MSEEYLAHSAKNEYPAQSYADHVNGTIEKALHEAKKMAEYCVRDEGQIENIVRFAAEYHDLGKLNGKNQKVLHESGEQNHHLPVNHADAGAAFIKREGNAAMYSLVLAYSHHQGLPNLNEEEQIRSCVFSDKRTGSQVRNGYGAGSFDTNPSKSYS